MNALAEPKSRAGRLALCAVMTALSMVLGYVEAMIPLPVPIPGIKLGIANLATIICFFMIGRRAACAVAVVRIVLSSLLFGNLYSFVFSMAGGLCSLLFMTAAVSIRRFSVTGVSMLGGVTHNLGQIAAAAAVLRAALVMGYIPALIAGGIVSGTLIGLLAYMILNRLRKAGANIHD